MSTPLLTRKELAKELRISLDGLDKLVHDPVRPLPHFRAGRRFLFDLAEVRDHLRVNALNTARKRGGRGVK